MTLKLYNFPQSTCSKKVRLVLWEKGIEFNDRPVNSKIQEHLSDWYLKLNPHGVVPTLIHDDAVIIDSSVIIEYVDEVFDGTPLSPADPVGKAHMRKWMRYFEEVPTPAVRVPSFNKYLCGRFDKLTDEEFDTFVDNHPIRKQFFKKMRKERGFDDRETDAALDSVLQTVQFMEKGLQKSGGPWLMGDQLTLADYCVVPIIDRMNDLGYSDLWNDTPRVTQWFEQIRRRESYAKTFYKGTRLSEIYDGEDYGAQGNTATIVSD
jgi:glutathione S-transferase